MNQTQNNQSVQNMPVVSDELDIKKLFMTLWYGKWIIMATTVLFAVGVYALSYFITPVWTATAITIKPGSEEIGNFAAIEQSVSSLDLNSSQKDIALSVNDVIYRQFIETVSSYDFKRQFWMTSDYYLNKSKDLKTEHEKAALLEKFILNIQFVAQDDRKGNQDTLLLKAETAQESSSLLKLYIDKANQSVINKLTKQNDNVRKRLVSSLESSITDLTMFAEDKFRIIFQKRNNELSDAESEYLQLSIKADARANEIELLKSKIADINAQIRELAYKGPEFDVRLDEYKLKLNELEKLPEISQFNQAFRFLRTPYEPITPDSPRRVFWAFLAALFGGFVGVCIALIRGPKVNPM
ncbi:LPS O-antigen chain length determinant protein WzzB [Thorsellia anophelis]|uniref:Lipopolysaccharide biosynthesis protein WzzE n=1 Tax=Thorsellia anophelis DSM 18579 TaxID=1123402 RepID=A0A1H9ZGB6_9GAMM|nr:Wzz/FepE/Etk N-terminal domain-containing protein [Thorsellia anophelis]SES80699.1 lipopolysaccharide biosynthesis protein WzzE [Thorsellia anophelis DSM 18579]